jgi:hypothetical protein
VSQHDCAPIAGATDPEYTVQAGDLGMTIELEVTASVEPPNHLPNPVVVDTTPSAIVTNPPGTPPTTTTTRRPPRSPSYSSALSPAIAPMDGASLGDPHTAGGARAT